MVFSPIFLWQVAKIDQQGVPTSKALFSIETELFEDQRLLGVRCRRLAHLHDRAGFEWQDGGRQSVCAEYAPAPLSSGVDGNWGACPSCL
jgi:hypothetical protein